MSSAGWTDYRDRPTGTSMAPGEILAPETDEPEVEVDYSGLESTSSADWTDYRNQSTETRTTPEQIISLETDEPRIEIDYSGFDSNPGLEEKYTVHNGMATGSRWADVAEFSPPRTTFSARDASDDSVGLFNRFWCLQHGVGNRGYAPDEVEKGLRVDTELRDKSIAISAVTDQLDHLERKAVRRMVYQVNLVSFNAHYAGLHGATLGAMIVLLYDDVESFEAGEGVTDWIDTYIKEISDSLEIPTQRDEDDPTALASYAFNDAWDDGN